jgi:hypothetical protein
MATIGEARNLADLYELVQKNGNTRLPASRHCLAS